jgi:FKBP-type peptidyl-prolyl cis-trans isomerase
MEFEA